MDKKKLFVVLLSAVVFAFLSMFVFVSYGGNNCDSAPDYGCDCFCCGFLGARGYEACGNFGLLFGAVFGMIIGLMILRVSAMLELHRFK